MSAGGIRVAINYANVHFGHFMYKEEESDIRKKWNNNKYNAFYYNSMKMVHSMRFNEMVTSLEVNDELSIWTQYLHCNR